MHRSGITCDEKLKKEFITAQDNSDLLYIKIGIEGENFKKIGEGKKGNDQESNFAIVQQELKPKSPCYILMKTPKDGKWLLIYFVPDDSVVKQKMLIASSYSDLKTGLGNSKFVGEWPLSSPDECTLDEYKKSLNDDSEQLLTWQEKELRDTEYEAQMSMTETKVSAVVGVKIPLEDSASQAIVSYQQAKCNTVIFSLNIEKETLGAEVADMKFENLKDKLPEREPRYILHNFKHERDGDARTKDVFVYYCPDKAKPRVRMFYSTAKANVLSTMEDNKIPEPKRIEISLPTELTIDALIEELYPKNQIKKVFKRPKPQGSGKKRFQGSKFQPK